MKKLWQNHKVALVCSALLLAFTACAVLDAFVLPRSRVESAAHTEMISERQKRGGFPAERDGEAETRGRDGLRQRGKGDAEDGERPEKGAEKPEPHGKEGM